MERDKKNNETKSSFFIIGQICDFKTSVKDEYGFSSNIIKKNNKKYNKIKFNLKTSKTNHIPVELFGMEQQYGFIVNEKTNKTEKVAWENRFNNTNPDFRIITSDYDKAKQIYDTYNDGDFISIYGTIKVETYESKYKQGVTTKNKYIIKTVKKIEEPIDFEADDFKEVNNFRAEVIFKDYFEDRKNNEFIVNAFVIDYFGVHENKFIIDMSKNIKFISTFKKFKYGDLIPVRGIIHNEFDFEDNPEWGDDYILNVKKFIEITGASEKGYKPQMYTKQELENEKIEDDGMFGNL